MAKRHMGGKKVRGFTVGAPAKNILAYTSGYESIAESVAQDHEAVKEIDGRLILEAGTVYPSNDANARGLVFQEYDLTHGDEEIALMHVGTVLGSRLPEPLSEEAKEALPRITVLDVEE